VRNFRSREGTRHRALAFTSSALIGFPMPSAVATKISARRRSRAKLAGGEIQKRLEQIELATVSSLRALQMDISGDAGLSSTEVLRKARLAVR